MNAGLRTPDVATRSPWERVAAGLGTVTSLGWSVAAVCATTWLTGALLGWTEFLVIAAACLVVLVLACAFLLGRAVLRVEVEVLPPRIPVGDVATGRITVTNVSSRRLLPLLLELPVGVARAPFDLPTLAPGASHEQVFVVPTERRAVIAVGPATTLRGDPLGLLRRTASWTEVTEIFVYPRLVPIESSSWGFLRDLEGRSTQDLSNSDLAFHALRPYQAGDDIRFVHWRSSARHGSIGNQQTLMVRQFVDTRRAHVVVLVDGRPGAYRSEDDFEAALAVAGSIAMRNVRDEQDTSLLAADQAVVRTSGQRLLDALARADHAEATLTDLARQSLHLTPDASMVVLVSGAGVSHGELRAAAAAFPPETRLLAVVADSTSAADVRDRGGLRTVTVPSVSALPRLIAAVAA